MNFAEFLKKEKWEREELFDNGNMEISKPEYWDKNDVDLEDIEKEYGKDDFVSVRALGEWAWKQFVFDGRTGRETRIWDGLKRAIKEYPRHLELAEKNNWSKDDILSFVISQTYFHPKKKFLEIAIACLGEAVVKKRLEAKPL